ncbi:crossover junction endonuclease EME1 [Anas acuta]|uniref:crossover junction endonuclease EME1 n=1 Tax=Anas acuta TaxID=28680 RepID=UPI0035C8CF94
MAAAAGGAEGRSPPSGPSPRPGSPPSPAWGSAVVVLSSDSEPEVVPLAERVKRRLPRGRPSAEGSAALGEGPCGSGQRPAAGGGGQAGTGGVLGAEVRPWGGANGAGGAERAAPGMPEAALIEPEARPGGSPPSGGSAETSPVPKRRKYSQKEREAMRQAAWQRRKEREARKKEQEQEKERKKTLAKILKAQRPGECQKYITVVLDPAILQVEGGAQVLAALQSANYSCVVERQAVPCSITWRRKAVIPQTEDGDEWTEEPNVLILLRLEEFLSMVRGYKQEAQGCAEGQKETLQSFVAQVLKKMPGKILAMTVVEVEKYFRCLRAQSKKRLQQATAHRSEGDEQRRKEVQDSGLEISRLDVEEALVDLQLCTQVPVTFFASWEEVGEFATMFSKAVAEAPYKRQQEKTGFSFYLENKWCRGVKVDPSGKGLFEVWKRQIQQFNRVSLEMAEAVVTAYPSPQLLDQAYSRCSSEQERENLLANILVRRGEGVTATSRRIGPELSRRIYLQMTSHDPDLYLDATG